MSPWAPAQGAAVMKPQDVVHSISNEPARKSGRGRAIFSRVQVVALVILAACGGGAAPSAPTPAGPRTLYVSPSGSDRSPGSIAQPWQTLKYAVSQLQAGDTLFVRGGTYTGGDNVIDSQAATIHSGASWTKPITIAGQPGERVTIMAPEGREGIRLTTGAPSYLIFQDLVIDMSNQTFGTGAGPTGVYVGYGSHHNRFLRLEIMNNQGVGIGFSSTNGNSPFNEIIDSSIHDNGRYPGENSGYGMYISTSDNLIEGNSVYNNSGYGMHFYDNSGPQIVSRNSIRRNRIYDNGTHGGTNYGIVIAWGEDNVITGNTIYRNRGGILVYTNGLNNQVFDNNIYENGPFPGILVQYARGTVVNDNAMNGQQLVDLGDETRVSGNR